MFKKILVATDFSKPSRAALAAAASLAERGSAKVDLIHVATLGPYVYSASPFTVPTSSLQEDLLAEMEGLVPIHHYPNIEHHVILGASIADEIQNYAANNSFDLIVIGSHGRGPIARFILGSVAQCVTRDSKIPVMVVRDFEHVQKRYQGFDRILVPTDFSQTSYKALALGINFANFLKADLDYIHVIDLPTVNDFSSIYPFLSMQFPQPSEMNVDLTLQKDLEQSYLVGNLKTATSIGDPVREILSYSEEHHCDFIVMGTHGRKGLDRVWMGSVAAGVIARSKIPVITVSTAHLETSAEVSPS